MVAKVCFPTVLDLFAVVSQTKILTGFIVVDMLRVQTNNSLIDNGKLVEKQGRKAMGLRF
jgi:hypothetical protein